MLNYIIFAVLIALIVFGLTFSREYWLSALIVAVIVGLLNLGFNYLALTVLAWGYWGMWFEILLTALICLAHGAFLNDVDDTEGGKVMLRSGISAGVVFLFMLGAGFFSGEMLNSRQYNERLGKVEMVTDGEFNSDVHPIPISKMRSVDGALARKVAEDKLGEDAGLGSRVEVGNMTIQNLTGGFVINNGQTLKFDNDLIWVAPLEHRSFWKWLSNDVTPGYIIVDATDATKRYLVTELNGKPLHLKYIESGVFNDDIERHIRLSGYTSTGLYDHCFEIDPNGNPYWVVSKYHKAIGFYAEEPDGVITIDVQTGEINSYGIEDAPAWIDRIQPQEFIEDQIRCWGEYKDGWWNSCFAEIGVQKPTEGMTLVYSEGKSFWYTGIKSSGADNGTNGFMLVDTRTKAARFYHIAGVNETEAMRIAQDQPFSKAAGYDADFPVLYNVRGIPTYFMTMKGSSGNIVGYCFVAVNNRQAVGSGISKKMAEDAYLKMLKRTFEDVLTDDKVKSEEHTFIVRGIVQENNTYYVLFQEVKGVEFTGTTEFYPELKWTRQGHRVKVTYEKGGGKIIPLESFDNLNVEI